MEAILEVDGMSCMHCVNKVTKVISGFKSAKDVKVDLDKKEAKFSFDESKEKIDDIIGAVKKAGFEAKKK